MAKKLCVFGEVLFDVFPDGKRVLGGAPFNVAWHLQSFGQSFGLSPCFISRVGNDTDGQTIRNIMQARGMSTAALQQDADYPTGLVSIKLVDGEPQYEIVCPSAYDNIEVMDFDADIQFLYHGTLALRQAASEKALKALLDKKPGTVFIDVNLRDPWWDKKTALNWVAQADWVKLNDDELALLYPSDQETKAQLAAFIAAFELDGVVLTHGSKGAEVLTLKGEWYSVSPSRDLQVVDTVGAGDAFSAVVILGLIHQWPMSETLQRAQAFASEIVQTRGATISNQQIYTDLLRGWGVI
jgi:fructokinase